MKILALEPYFGGSHKAFLEGWIRRSRHQWTLLTLPPRKWKWRMRHSAITFAGETSRLGKEGEKWDCIFASDMLDLAGFRGLSSPALQRLPAVAYFHENQLTYPVLHEKEYDYHFAFSNLTTALSADEVWFNSAFHRDSFLGALPKFLRRMPDYIPLEEVESIRPKTRIHSPPIENFRDRGKRKPGPMRILWAARWEYDKRPDIFFKALDILEKKGVDFRISAVGGGNARTVLPVFINAEKRFRDRIIHWGWQESRKEYRRVLEESDVAVSTADHEFFGISMAEAAAAGGYPLVPERLAYPEVLGPVDAGKRDSFFFQGGEEGLARRLEELAGRLKARNLWQGDPERARKKVERFYWENRVPVMDADLDILAGSGSETSE